MSKSRQWLTRYAIFLIIILAGIAFKFHGLESRFFWLDEIYTIFHTSGKSTDTFWDKFPADSIVNISYYNEMLDLNSGQYSIGSQLKGLTQMPQFTPLHYFFLALWHRIAGSEQIDYRLFSILIFILTLPLLYLATKNMIGSKRAGLIATSLFAVSPFIHNYAQDSRYYILWIFSIILLHLLIIKALEKNTTRSWILYTAGSIFALYVSTLTGIIIIGHFLYAWLLHKEMRVRLVVSDSLALLAYAPWLIFIIANTSAIKAALTWQIDDPGILAIILGPWSGMAHIFSYTEDFAGIYSYFNINSHTPEIVTAIALNIVLIGLIITSLVFLIRNSPAKVKWFILLITIPGVLFFNLYDIIGHRFISVTWRYHSVYFIGTIMLVSWFLDYISSWNRILFPLVYASIVFLGLISMNRISNDDCWAVYGFEHCEEKVIAAELFSNDEHPLIITDCATDLGKMGFLETIAACNSDNIDILFTPSPDNLGKILEGRDYSNIYLYHTSFTLEQFVTKAYRETQLASLYPLPVLTEDYITDLLEGRNESIDSYYIDPELELTKSLIHFVVMPEDMPPESTIYITGNHPSIGNWQADAIPLEESPDGTWLGSFKIENNHVLEYKFTRGTWETEFADKRGNVMPNFRLNIIKDTTIAITIENWKDLIE